MLQYIVGVVTCRLGGGYQQYKDARMVVSPKDAMAPLLVVGPRRLPSR